MGRATLILAGVVAAAAASSASPFNWQPCAGSNDPRAQCGWLKVPLNHLDASSTETIDIAVRVYRATGRSKGTILLNPGGPGGSGLPMASPTFLAITGGEHDVLGFDPRGVGLSRPATCTQSAYTGTRESTLRNAKPIPFERDSTNTSFSQYLLEFEMVAKRCNKYDGDYLKYLSTAFIARDMDMIRAALGEDVLNFYGISYGTFLGLTYVNMFPHRVGRVVIDSVLDPALYLGQTPTLMSTSLVDTEKPFEGFCAYCEDAGPELCPLADASAARPYLSARLRQFFHQMSETPVVAMAGDDWAIVTDQALRAGVFNYIIFPSAWPKLASWLHTYVNGAASLPAPASSCAAGNAAYSNGDTGWIVYVANEGDNSKTQVSDWEETLKKCQKASPLFGGSWYTPALPAQFWTTQVVEKYTGPWNNTLRTPILILNNHFDPETPLVSAQAVAATMGPENAVLVTRDGFGHGTIGHPSQCLNKIMTNFFNDGSLPPANTNCGVDGNPFVLQHMASVFGQATQASAVLAAARSASAVTAHQAPQQVLNDRRTSWKDAIWQVASFLANWVLW